MSNIYSYTEKMIASIVEMQDKIIMQKIVEIRGTRYRHITIDKNKVAEALQEYETRNNPLTNADRIRGMSDEELAEIINERKWCDEICSDDYGLLVGIHCETCILDWLKQPWEGE